MKETKLGDNLGYLLNSTTNTLNTFMQRTISKHDIDVPLEQMKVLLFVCLNEGVNQQMICERMGRVKPGVSRLVDGLEKKGLISRMEDKNDRRNKLIKVTDKGIAIRNNFYPIALQNLKAIEKLLGEKESVQLKKHLIGIKEILLNKLNSEK